MLHVELRTIIDRVIFYCFILYSITFLFSEEIGNSFIRMAFLLGIIKYIKYKNVYFSVDCIYKYLKPFFVFFGVIFVFFFIHGIGYLSASKYETLIKMIIPFCTALFFISDKKQIKWILLTLCAGVIINEIYSIYDFFIQNNSRTHGINMWTLYFAGILLLQLPILLCLLIKGKLSKFKNIILIFLLALTLLTIFTNGSRMTWLITVVDFIILSMFFIKSFKKKIAVMLGIFLVLFSMYNINSNINAKVNSLFDANNISTRGHYFYLRDGMNLFLEHKLIGVGLNNFNESILNDNLVSQESINNLKKDLHVKINDKYVMPHAHNDMVMFLSELGILGGFIYIYLFGSILIYTMNNWRKNKDIWSLSICIMTINILIRGLSDYNLANMGVMSLYFFMYSLYLRHIFLISDKRNEVIKGKYLGFIFGGILLVVLLRIGSKHFMN